MFHHGGSCMSEGHIHLTGVLSKEKKEEFIASFMAMYKYCHEHGIDPCIINALDLQSKNKFAMQHYADIAEAKRREEEQKEYDSKKECVEV
jgi:hypothetical protein